MDEGLPIAGRMGRAVVRDPADPPERSGTPVGDLDPVPTGPPAAVSAGPRGRFVSSTARAGG